MAILPHFREAHSGRCQDSRNAAHHASRAGAVDVLQFLATKGIDLSGLDSVSDLVMGVRGQPGGGA